MCEFAPAAQELRSANGQCIDGVESIDRSGIGVWCSETRVHLPEIGVQPAETAVHPTEMRVRWRGFSRRTDNNVASARPSSAYWTSWGPAFEF